MEPMSAHEIHHITLLIFFHTVEQEKDLDKEKEMRKWPQFAYRNA